MQVGEIATSSVVAAVLIKVIVDAVLPEMNVMATVVSATSMSQVAVSSTAFTPVTTDCELVDNCVMTEAVAVAPEVRQMAVAVSLGVIRRMVAVPDTPTAVAVWNGTERSSHVPLLLATAQGLFETVAVMG